MILERRNERSMMREVYHEGSMILERSNERSMIHEVYHKDIANTSIASATARSHTAAHPAYTDAYSSNWLSAQTNHSLTNNQFNEELAVLATAFPTIVRSYDQAEYTALQNLWYAIFQQVPQEVFREAIRRFIINDRKGFFPSPGQIVGHVEQIIAEAQKRQKEESAMRFQAEYNEYRNRIQGGENCETCKHGSFEDMENRMFGVAYDQDTYTVRHYSCAESHRDCSGIAVLMVCDHYVSCS